MGRVRFEDEQPGKTGANEEARSTMDDLFGGKRKGKGPAGGAASGRSALDDALKENAKAGRFGTGGAGAAEGSMDDVFGGGRRSGSGGPPSKERVGSMDQGLGYAKDYGRYKGPPKG